MSNSLFYVLFSIFSICFIFISIFFVLCELFCDLPFMTYLFKSKKKIWIITQFVSCYSGQNKPMYSENKKISNEFCTGVPRKSGTVVNSEKKKKISNEFCLYNFIYEF